jgi:predicted 3-demethylubiquinone-9 3-methyltransferase (glyoxalase superfamily)/heme-degrading monooxygenase HmoA
VRTGVDADAHAPESRLASVPPESPIAVVFVSRRTTTHDAEYAALAARMEELARQQPGFVEMVSVRDQVTRQGITVAYFDDEESARAWKANPEHAEAQRRGITDFYEDYDVTVASILRQYSSSARKGDLADKPDATREGGHRRSTGNDREGGRPVKGISTFLWFDGQALSAARFYVSIFPNSVVHADSTFPDVEYPENAQADPGSVMTVSFELDGRPFTALNGGPQFSFTPAVSFVVSCENQDEVDYFWERLTEGGGEPGQCGWLTDRFGVSWQVVPTALSEIMSGPDPEGAQRAFQAMMGMGRLDIAGLQRAYDGVES